MVTLSRREGAYLHERAHLISHLISCLSSQGDVSFDFFARVQRCHFFLLFFQSYLNLVRAQSLRPAYHGLYWCLQFVSWLQAKVRISASIVYLRL